MESRGEARQKARGKREERKNIMRSTEYGIKIKKSRRDLKDDNNNHNHQNYTIRKQILYTSNKQGYKKKARREKWFTSCPVPTNISPNPVEGKQDLFDE